jgi:hypothetical protein
MRNGIPRRKDDAVDCCRERFQIIIAGNVTDSSIQKYNERRLATEESNMTNTILGRARGSRKASGRPLAKLFREVFGTCNSTRNNLSLRFALKITMFIIFLLGLDRTFRAAKMRYFTVRRAQP